MRVKRKAKRKTCQQVIAERIEANRDRQVEQAFDELEQQLLNKKEKHEDL